MKGKMGWKVIFSGSQICLGKIWEVSLFFFPVFFATKVMFLLLPWDDKTKGLNLIRCFYLCFSFSLCAGFVPLEGFILISEAGLEVVCDQATQLYQQRQTGSLEHHLSFFRKNFGLALFGQVTPRTTAAARSWVVGSNPRSYYLVEVGEAALQQ